MTIKCQVSGLRGDSHQQDPPLTLTTNHEHETNEQQPKIKLLRRQKSAGELEVNALATNADADTTSAGQNHAAAPPNQDNSNERECARVARSSLMIQWR